MTMVPLLQVHSFSIRPILSGFSLLSIFLIFMINTFSSVLARPASTDIVGEHVFLHPSRETRSCQTFRETFSGPSSVSNTRDGDPSSSNFVAISPTDTYAVTSNGLEMYLLRPKGEIRRSKDGTNDKLGEGATINSTFYLEQGQKVTYEVSTLNAVPGVVTAVILIDWIGSSTSSKHTSDDETHLDEIDIEFLGSDPSHFQTNVFKPSKADPSPHFGAFSSIESVDSITNLHKYSIHWESDKLTWELDGNPVRTLEKKDTYINGVSHFPTDPLRLQMGIWDGSGAPGTSEWCGGPIDWDHAPRKIKAVVKSVEVSC